MNGPYRERRVNWLAPRSPDRPCATTELLLGQILLRLVCRISSEECGPQPMSGPSVHSCNRATDQSPAANEAEAGKWSDRESDA